MICLYEIVLKSQLIFSNTLTGFEFIINGPPVSQQTRRRQRLKDWKETVKQEAE